MIPGKLTVRADGKIEGPAAIDYNEPWPCANGTPGGGSSLMMGVVEHTTVGTFASAVAWFNNPASQASAFFVVSADGEIHQFGPVGVNWMAWAQGAGNPEWYSIEFSDNGNPATPLTPAQIEAGAQLLECLSRFAGFPLQLSDSVSVMGFGWHGMGGQAWGNHPNCPGDVRKAQRPEMLELAKQIRGGTPPAVQERVVVDLPGGASRKEKSTDGGKTWQ